MANLPLRLGVIVQHFAEGFCAAEGLMLPEIASLDSTPEAAVRVLRELLPKMLAEGSPLSISQRQVPGELGVFDVSLKLDPPRRGAYWRQALPLIFHALSWAQPDGLQLAYLPALRVAAAAEDAAELPGQLEKEIRFALQRLKVAASLADLVDLQRVSRVELQHEEIVVAVKSAKQRGQEAAEKTSPEKSALEEVATDLARQVLPRAIGIDGVVERVAEALLGRAARSVLLVGRSGVGKTAAVYELVRQREARGLGERQFWATSGSRLVAGAVGFGGWQERCHRLCREVAGRGAILYLGNLVELLEVGKSDSNNLSIAGFLRGTMARGELLGIAECTPEQFAVLERRDPHLLSAFRQVKVEEPSREVGRRILRHVAGEAGGQRRRLSEEALDVVERLHRRYARYSGFPGRPIRFLNNLLKEPGGQIVEAGEVTGAFARETGLPLFMLDDSAPLDLTAARAWFAGRVIAQDAAAELVSDLLATLKARLNRPGRPIASLLFIGPTGVGKTEMAKAITEYFFSDRGKIARFDMSEYNTPAAVERLVGGFGRPEGTLTARIRQEPFSVVLFDEIEKAHGGFFDLMLQVLGEGRLTDAVGRLADFSNCIIIMTSNLGGASFGRSGFGLREAGSGDAARHFTEEVRAFFRPELFNRIDRIVPFAPLGAAAIGRIARRELELVRGREGLRLRDVKFDLDDAGAEYLARRGFDPTYGARPLKRAIERELLAPLAESLNAYAENLPLVASVRAEKAGLRVHVRATGEPPKAHGPGPGHANRAAILRRHVQRLQRSAALLDVRNELFRLEGTIAREQIKRPNHPQLPAWFERLSLLRGPVAGADAIGRDVVEIEEAVLAEFYEGQGTQARDWPGELAGAEQRLAATLLDLYALRFANPHLATVAVFGERAADLFDLANAYCHTAGAHGASAAAGWYDHDARGLLLRRVEKAGEYLAGRSGKPIGIVLELAARHILPLLQAEQGSHMFIRGKAEQPCLVMVHAGSMSGFLPPPDVHRHGAIVHTTWRRRIDMDARTLKDFALDRETRWTRLEATLRELIEEHLGQAIREPLTT